MSEIKHLGNILQSDNSMKSDCLSKRGKFIGIVNSLLQEFHFVAPSILVKLINIYASSFYGSSLWDLYSPQVDKIYKSWNVNIRNIFNLPWRTHRYWIEIVSDCHHPKTFLSSRFVNFVNTLKSCKKKEVRFLASLCLDDKRTMFGKTLDRISREVAVEESLLTPGIVKRTLKYCCFPMDKRWQVPILLELIEMKNKKSEIENFSYEDTKIMIDMICTN